MKKKKIMRIAVTSIALFIIALSVITVHSSETGKRDKNISLLGKREVSVKYSDTVKSEGGQTDIYLDDSKNEYIYKGNKLVGYLKNKRITEETARQASRAMARTDIRTDEGLKQTAIDIAQSIIDESVNFDDYPVIDINYIESYAEIQYTFRRTIGGYKTNEGIVVSLNPDGSLSSFSASRVGLLDNYKDISIDDNAIEEFINNRITYKYGDINYEVEDKIIDIVDGEPVLKCYIALTYDNDMRDSTILTYYIFG